MGESPHAVRRIAWRPGARHKRNRGARKRTFRSKPDAMPSPIDLEARRVLREAARFIAHGPGRVIWSRRLKRQHSRLGRDYRVELGRDLRLRVYDTRSALMVCEASALDAMRLLLPRN